MSTLKLWPVLAFCMLVQSACIHRAGAEDVAASIGPDVEKYNIVWDSPSENPSSRPWMRGTFGPVPSCPFFTSMASVSGFSSAVNCCFPASGHSLDRLVSRW